MSSVLSKGAALSDVTVPPAANAGGDRLGDKIVEEAGFKHELRREFGFFHAFAISFADTSLIVAFYGSFALALGASGPTFIWGMLLVLVGQILVSLILGEVASRWPLEGGIYQWTREQTGARSGWFSGWAYWWTMVFTMTSCAYAASSFILPGVGVDSPSKGELIGLAIVIVLIGYCINAIAQVVLKIFVSILLVAEVTTTIGLSIILFFFYRVHPFSTLFHSFNAAHNSGMNWLWFGWFGAIAFMGWTFLGFDAAGSIAEEVHDPAKNVPRAIVGVCIGIGIATMFVTLAFILSIPNIAAAMTGNIADPASQTITAHLGSGLTKPVLLMISMGFIGSMVALHTAGSRTLYSFARDRQIAGSSVFTVLSRNRKLPWVALLFTALVSILILLINIGASKVFTTLMTISVAGFFISYGFAVISQLVLHFNGRYRPGPFNLGKFSFAATLIASAWIVFETINVCWPRSPSLPWYQNWGVLTVTLALAAAGWIVYVVTFGRQGGGEAVSAVGAVAGGATTPPGESET
jgi:amino acid transporter